MANMALKLFFQPYCMNISQACIKQACLAPVSCLEVCFLKYGVLLIEEYALYTLHIRPCSTWHTKSQAEEFLYVHLCDEISSSLSKCTAERTDSCISERILTLILQLLNIIPHQVCRFLHYDLLYLWSQIKTEVFYTFSEMDQWKAAPECLFLSLIKIEWWFSNSL